ncbi:hypothetical protein [Bosea sp. MMO-172]
MIYQRTNAAYGKLIAYVACAGPADDKAILTALGHMLPDYMVPRA